MYKDLRVAAVVLARARSTRLPGKMMLPFGDTTVVAGLGVGLVFTVPVAP